MSDALIVHRRAREQAAEIVFGAQFTLREIEYHMSMRSRLPSFSDDLSTIRARLEPLRASGGAVIDEMIEHAERLEKDLASWR